MNREQAQCPTSVRVIGAARLDLVPMTLALVEAELEGAHALALALGVPLPPDWPPELYDRDDLERMQRLLTQPADVGWAIYYLIERASRRLIGVAGFAGAPTEAGLVELGYSVLPPSRRQGYATEAVAALVAHAFAQQGVERVTAQTLPGLTASIAVLERSGFALLAADPAASTVRYELTRSDFDARARH